MWLVTGAALLKLLATGGFVAAAALLPSPDAGCPAFGAPRPTAAGLGAAARPPMEPLAPEVEGCAGAIVRPRPL